MRLKCRPGHRAGRVCLALAVTLGPAAAFAQDGADPGNIERRVEDARPDRPVPTPGQKPEVQAEPEPAAEREDAQSGAFVLAAVLVEGATAFDRQRFASAYEEFLATRVTQAEMTTIARRITQIYRDAGYVLSRARVPAQNIAGGVLRIQVVEGWIERVELSGAESFQSSLRPLLDPVLADRPVRIGTIERSLMLLQDRAGVSLQRSRVVEADAPGAHVLRLELEGDAYDGTAYLDNRGVRSSGRWQSWLSGAENDRLGLGERVEIGLFTVPDAPDELRYLEGRWTQPVGNAGTHLEGVLSGSESDAGADLAASNTESSSRSASLELQHPLLRQRRHSLWGLVTFDATNYDEHAFGQRSYEDRVRSLRLGAEYWAPDLWDGSLYVTVTGSVGLDVLNASDDATDDRSRGDADATYRKLEAELQRVQQLPGRFSLLGKVKGQVAGDPLLSSEEVGLGGSGYGRAYEFGELTGEDGLAGGTELRYSGEATDFGDAAADWLANWQLYAFYDLGAVWNDNATGNFRRQSLASAGGGLRVTLEQGLWGQIEIAQPLTLTPDDTGNRDPRVFVAMNWRF